MFNLHILTIFYLYLYYFIVILCVLRYCVMCYIYIYFFFSTPANHRILISIDDTTPEEHSEANDKILNTDLSSDASISNYSTDFSTILSPSFFASSSSAYSSTHSSISSKHSNTAAFAVVHSLISGIDSAACSLESKISNESNPSASGLLEKTENSEDRGVDDDASLNQVSSTLANSLGASTTGEHASASDTPKTVEDFEITTPIHKETIINENFGNNLDSNTRKNYEKSPSFIDNLPVVSNDNQRNLAEIPIYANTPLILEDITEACDEDDFTDTENCTSPADDDNITSMVLFRSSPGTIGKKFLPVTSERSKLVAEISNVIPGSSLNTEVYDDLSDNVSDDLRELEQSSVLATDEIVKESISCGRNQDIVEEQTYSCIENNDVKVDSCSNDTCNDDVNGVSGNGDEHHIYDVPSFPSPSFNFTASPSSSRSPSLRHTAVLSNAKTDAADGTTAFGAAAADGAAATDGGVASGAAAADGATASGGGSVAGAVGGDVIDVTTTEQQLACDTDLLITTDASVVLIDDLNCNEDEDEASLSSSLTRPEFLDPGELGSPYENVLIPIVIERTSVSSGILFYLSLLLLF